MWPFDYRPRVIGLERAVLPRFRRGASRPGIEDRKGNPCTEGWDGPALAFFPRGRKLLFVFNPIISKSGGYEASTDGLELTIRRDNGVVVGEGQVEIGRAHV